MYTLHSSELYQSADSRMIVCSIPYDMVASTWLGDHQGRSFASTNSLHKLHMVHYQVLLIFLLHLLILDSESQCRTECQGKVVWEMYKISSEQVEVTDNNNERLSNTIIKSISLANLFKPQLETLVHRIHFPSQLHVFLLLLDNVT